MDFIKKFSEHDDYVLYKEGGEMDLPNVSRCDDKRDIHLNHNLIKTPLTFRVLSKGEIKWGTTNVENALTISYKKNTGDWTQITATTDGVFIPVDKGDEVSFKGNNGSYTLVGEATSVNSFMGTTCYFSLYGNIMSLVNGDNFATSFEFPSETDKNFFNLFKQTNCINAQHLVLPAETVPGNSYNSMFFECYSLLTAPELPGKTLNSGSYANMYRNCTSLHKPETELPALHIANGAYNYMHSNNHAITKVPEIKATSVGQQSCERMFNGCKGLTSTQQTLYTTSVGNHAFDCMFIGCENLVSAFDLPAATVDEGGYYAMFYGCTSLLAAPAITATTLGEQACVMMFQGCTSLASSPALPAMNLSTSCYEQMFYECESLTSFPTLPATTLPAAAYRNMFCETGLLAAPEIMATSVANSSLWNMFDNCDHMITGPSILRATDLSGTTQCYRGMFKECYSLQVAPQLPATKLGKQCYLYMFQNCQSLVNPPALPATELAEGCYSGMFNNCWTLGSTPTLSATTLFTSCYYRMFLNCRAITTAPALPAIVLAQSCYGLMFNGCTSLTTAPVLGAYTLVEACYQQMFTGCTSLNSITCLATDLSATNCLQNWVQNVASTGTFTRDSDTTWPSGNSGIPANWTVNTVDDGIQWD